VVSGATVSVVGAIGQDVVGTSVGAVHRLRHDAWPCGTPTATAVPDDGRPPAALGFLPNAPNPFGASTELVYEVPPGTEQVSIRVYDIAGRLVRTLIDGPVSPGRWSLRWDGTDTRGRGLPSGVYYGVLSAAGQRRIHKMVLVR
jgi:hypothetical protein